jgi:YjbE family integral membrane protein
MFDTILPGATAAPLTALLQVLMIDLVLAGDNAVAVGLAAGGLPTRDRRKVIACGLAAAVVLRIAFALAATWLLGLTGLLLTGGLLLLWVCWKMWCELRAGADHDALTGEDRDAAQAKTFRQALLQILVADVSMSLDNVLAVAGAAREHPVVLAIGLMLSILLMGLAAGLIASALQKHRWIGYVGLAIVVYVALHMIWEGHRDVVVDLDRTQAYNALAPSFIDITPIEQARHEIAQRKK